ncbi:MAG: GNAT family N-acetyltransferase [Steroidobacteraceae bacterium]|nr:GNAT family N-acetyltransferase [Steroidobacteraceae bacterium]
MLGVMEVVVRSASDVDAADVVRVLRCSRLRFLPYAPPVHSEAQTLQWVRSNLIPSGGMSVATIDGQVVGVVAVSQADGASWIDQLYVDPEYCGRGVGSQLLEVALSALPRPVRLYSFQQNDGARRFYERHGFSAIRHGDGSSNEEDCPDTLYERGVAGDAQRQEAAIRVG